MKHIKISEDDIPSKERIWDKQYQCRDFELSNFWQKSAFLFGFLSLCFAGYGALVLKIVDDDFNIDYVPYIYQYMCGVSLLGIILSVVWIYMMKGSKAWYEVYEKSIYAIESDIFTNNQQYVAGEFAKKMRGDFNANFMGLGGGAFSPSKINILIGWILLIVWCTCGLFSLYNLFFEDIEKPDCIKLCVCVGIIILLSVLIPVFIKLFIKSSPLLRVKVRGYFWKYCWHLINKYIALIFLFLVIVAIMSFFYSSLCFVLPLLPFFIILYPLFRKIYYCVIDSYNEYVKNELKKANENVIKKCVYDKANDYLSVNLRDSVEKSTAKKKRINQDIDKKINSTIQNLIEDTIDDNINLIINKYLDKKITERVKTKLEQILQKRINEIGENLSTSSISLNTK